MTTYNTGNPIGSTEVKDLYDNAQNFDTLSTTTTLETVPDRLGVPRMSLHGFEQEARRRFESIKFQPPIPYAPGIEVTTSSLTVDYLGVLYYALPSALPFTTGAWDPAQWSPLQNTNPGNELLVFDDYASASAAAATLPDGQMVQDNQSKYRVIAGELVFIEDILLKQLSSTDPGKGAALVGFKQSGTAVVARTVQDKVQEILSVNDFSAGSVNANILAALTEVDSSRLVTFSRSAHFSNVPSLQEITAKMRAGKTVKIACYGDSTTDGNNTTGWTANPTSGGGAVGTTDHESTAPNAWPARLKSILREMFSNNNIHVWNAGYSGQRMNNGWALDNYDLAVTNNPAYGVPDVCFIGFGLNDITDTDVYASHLKQTLALCIKLISVGTLPVLLTCDAIQRNDPSARDSEEATQEVDSAKKTAARKLGIPLLESGAALRQWASCNSSGYTWAALQPDDLHFGDLGHSFKAGFVAANLYPDLILASDGLEVVAQDPRWQLNSSLSWVKYTTSGPKSGRNYYATASGGQELLKGWIWNTNPEVDLHALTIAGGGTDALPPRSYYELLDTVANTTRSVQISGVKVIGLPRTTDKPLTIPRIPVGLSKITSFVKPGEAIGGSYSSDLLFLKTTPSHSTLHNLRLPASVVGILSPEASGVIKFYAPEIYRHDYARGDDVRVEVNAHMPIQTGILLWHSRCFWADGSRIGGKTRIGLSLFVGSSMLYLTIANGNPDGSIGYTFVQLGTCPIGSVTVNADGTYSFLCDLTWSSGVPTITVKLIDGTVLISSSLDGRDCPVSGFIGGLIQRTDSVSPPVIKSMTWSEL